MRAVGRLATGLGVVTIGLSGALASAPAIAGVNHYRVPVAKPLPDPGVVHTGRSWVVLSTGNWKSLHVGVASSPGGPYRVSNRKLLSRRPAWMSPSNSSVWAPSIIEATPGHFAVYYAGVVKGTKARRCIGSATGPSALGPFKPSNHPIACWSGSGPVLPTPSATRATASA